MFYSTINLNDAIMAELRNNLDDDAQVWRPVM